VIGWVVALRSEAAPLIAHHRLRSYPRATPWPLYTSFDGEMALVISGVGRAASAAASGWLGGYLRPPAHAAWINVGIAGHSQGPIGRTLVADRVVERATGRAWYPPAPAGSTLAGDTVFTVDQPERDFSEVGAYDMEAAAFLAAAGRWCTAELAQVVKVISDTPEAPPTALDRRTVEKLIENRLDDIASFTDAVCEVAGVIERRGEPPLEYEELTNRWRFTVTQRRQLRRLLQRYWALSPEGRDLETVDAKDARGAIRILEERVHLLSLESF